VGSAPPSVPLACCEQCDEQHYAAELVQCGNRPDCTTRLCRECRAENESGWCIDCERKLDP